MGTAISSFAPLPLCRPNPRRRKEKREGLDVDYLKNVLLRAFESGAQRWPSAPCSTCPPCPPGRAGGARIPTSVVGLGCGAARLVALAAHRAPACRCCGLRAAARLPAHPVFLALGAMQASCPPALPWCLSWPGCSNSPLKSWPGCRPRRQLSPASSGCPDSPRPLHESRPAGAAAALQAWVGRKGNSLTLAVPVASRHRSH